MNLEIYLDRFSRKEINVIGHFSKHDHILDLFINRIPSKFKVNFITNRGDNFKSDHLNIIREFNTLCSGFKDIKNYLMEMNGHNVLIFCPLYKDVNGLGKFMGGTHLLYASHSARTIEDKEDKLFLKCIKDRVSQDPIDINDIKVSVFREKRLKKLLDSK